MALLLSNAAQEIYIKSNLLLFVKQVKRKSGFIEAVLADPTGEVRATLQPDTMDKYGTIFKPGTTIHLHQVMVVAYYPQKKDNRPLSFVDVFHLVIRASNIVQIFSDDINVDGLELNEFKTLQDPYGNLYDDIENYDELVEYKQQSQYATSIESIVTS